VLTRGNRNECPAFGPLVAAARAARPRKGLPARLAADRGYNADRIRAWLARRGVEPVIPPRRHERPRACDRRAYRARNVVERCVGRLKECRRVATRYEKLAVNFAAMVTVAMIVLYLRLPL
jgi:transposase